MKLVSRFAVIVLATVAGNAAAQNAVTDRVAMTGPSAGDLSASRPPTSAEIQIPRPLERRNPRYPRAAFRQGIEGSVLLEFSVDADGHVVAARVLESTPPGVFEHAALDAVSAWTYQPLGIETKDMKVRLTFRMRGDAQSKPTPPSPTLVREDDSHERVASEFR